MQKLIRGIVDFRRNMRPGYRKTFARLALEQRPDVLFIGCSDSRVVPNLFASSDPGDLFVMRNVGNLVAPCAPDGVSIGDLSEGGAVEFALLELQVKHIVVCGHSECGAIKALRKRPDQLPPHLSRWLENAREAQVRFDGGASLDKTLTEHNQVAQLNVMLQVEHLRTYPAVAQAEKAGRLTLHAWYFDIGHADVYAYEHDEEQFVLIDETEGERLLARMGG